MSVQITDELFWQQEGARLYLLVSGRRVAAPELLTQLLLGWAGHGLSNDPAGDLLQLEFDLRCYTGHIVGHAADVAEEVSYGSDAVAIACAEGGLIGRWQRSKAFEYFAVAAATYLTLTSRRRCVWSWISQLRQFVIDARVPHGLLAQAASGWQRRPTVPSYVRVFSSVVAFVSDDTSRADPTWWAYQNDVPTGVSYGDYWRRDGDDDDSTAAPMGRSGPWRLTYLPQTAEVYGVRRAGRQPEQIWLLGTDIENSGQVLKVLTELQGRMCEPNSLILAAQTIHSTV